MIKILEEIRSGNSKWQKIRKFLNTNSFYPDNKRVYYFCDFAVSDIKIAVYLESPRKLILIQTFLVSKISQKTGFNY